MLALRAKSTGAGERATVRGRATRVLVVAFAGLALSVVAPGEASAGDCGYVAYGKDYKIRLMGRVVDTSTRYHVYTFGSGSMSCVLARQWARQLSFRPHSGGLARAWPDNRRTVGYRINGSLPPGYTCRRGPVAPDSDFDVGPVYCRRVPEPKGYARFYFFPADTPDP